MIFKYYHGTSTIFLDSIRKYGLGAINPSIDLKNLDVLEFLFNQSEKYLSGNLEYIKLREPAWAMINQTEVKKIDARGIENTLYFRHDGIFVSLSRVRAAYYATNQYGSEILEKSIELYNLLCKEGINISIPKEIDIFNFRQYINKNAKPIVIEVLNVKDGELEKEDGKTATEALDLLRKKIPMMTQKMKFEFLQFCNFKLLKPIPPSQLRFYEMEYEGSPRDHNFEFTLSKI